MVLGLSQSDCLWILLASALTAACGLILAIFALIRSENAYRASIPGPEVRCALAGFTVVRMRACDEHQFAISRLEARNGNFLVVANIKLKALPDMLNGYSAPGKQVKSMTFVPPATSLIVRTSNSHEAVRICVVCRQAPHIRRWVELPLSS